MVNQLVPLADLTAEAAPEFGGKAANLGELMRLAPRLPLPVKVPNGWAIPSAAFEAWLAQANITDEGIQRVLEAVGADPERLTEASELFLDVLKAYFPDVDLSPIPDDPEATYAVRSSAVGEDSGVNSFAGQHDTCLNTPRKQLLPAVQQVWLSSFNNRALYYRIANGLMSDPIRQGVVIQDMVPAVTSGVAFSANPVTGNPGEVVVEMVQGLGDKLVSGQATPSTDTHDASKLRQATKDSPLSERVGLLTLALQEILGYPCDVEWASTEDMIYLLQVRPITYLPVYQDVAKHEGPVTYIHPTYGPATLIGEGLAPGFVTSSTWFDRETYIASYDIDRNFRLFVVPFTTPDDLPNMRQAAGVVVSEGGVTSHAAIVCRELGKPCVRVPDLAQFKKLYADLHGVAIDGKTGAVWRCDLDFVDVDSPEILPLSEPVPLASLATEDEEEEEAEDTVGIDADELKDSGCPGGCGCHCKGCCNCYDCEYGPPPEPEPEEIDDEPAWAAALVLHSLGEGK